MTSIIVAVEVGIDMSFYSDVYTIDKFIELIELGTITDYDGYGYYSFDGEEELELVPLDSNKIYKTSAQKGYKYIIWYNR